MPYNPPVDPEKKAVPFPMLPASPARKTFRRLDEEVRDLAKEVGETGCLGDLVLFSTSARVVIRLLYLGLRSGNLP